MPAFEGCWHVPLSNRPYVTMYDFIAYICKKGIIESIKKVK